MKIGKVASLIVALVGVVLCHKKTVKSRDDEIEVKKNDDKVWFSLQPYSLRTSLLFLSGSSNAEIEKIQNWKRST